MAPLTVEQILNELHSKRTTTLLDVRAPIEFHEGHIPGSINEPILTDSERHEVGLTYKEQGQEAAVRLGHSLVLPDRHRRVERWRHLWDRSAPLTVTCWRGGLRSKTACEWLNEADVPTRRVEGGYKAMRQALLNRLEKPFQLWVVGGWTGTGKTRLLNEFGPVAVDLEGLAKHRGSAIGWQLFEKQPTQANFENAILLATWDLNKTYLVEDESSKMGSVLLPIQLKTHIRQSPVVFLTAPMEKRVQDLFGEYVLEPLAKGYSYEKLGHHYIDHLAPTRRRLGGRRFQDLMELVRKAFEQAPSLDAHGPWIEFLLREHYDRTYGHAFHKLGRKILFEGDWESARDYLKQAFPKR